MTFSTALKGQELKCFKTSEYAAFVAKIQKGYDAMDSLTVLKRVVSQLEVTLQASQQEAKANEDLAGLQKSKADNCEEEKKALTAIISGKDRIISLQADNIKRLGGRPKRFAIGLGGGYGYYLGSTVQRGAFIGAFAGWTIARF